MKRTVLAALLVLWLSAAAYAQQPLPSEKSPQVAAESPLTSPAPSIHLFFAVTDHKGHPAPDVQLSKEDLEVRDEGKPTDGILEVRRAADMPIRYALVLDLSSSVKYGRTRTVPMALATVDFLRASLRPGLDDAEVIPFRAGVSAPIPFRPDELSSQLSKVTLGGGTALYDALLVACQSLASAKRERSVILLLSDGVDNQSKHTLQEVKQAALRSGVTLFFLNTGSPTQISFGSPTVDFSSAMASNFRQLPRETGGRESEPNNLKDVSKELTEIADHLRSQYWLVYRPLEMPTNGTLRKLKIDVRGRSNLKIQAPAGYYAPQE